MMSKKDDCQCNSMERVERTLPDGFSYYYYQCPRCNRVDYPPCEAQKLLEYSKTHTFLFLDDWILLWLYIGDGAPVCGITKLQKDIFIVTMEFAQKNNIPSENPGFKAYKFGPYTERIDRSIDTLTKMGLVKSVGRLNTDVERFFLTESGINVAAKLSRSLTQEQMKALRELREDLQQFSAQGEMTYVYAHYPEYTDESVVFERTLHRRRNR